jgi:glycosyltransferase involved in cell wall biosynthesis
MANDGYAVAKELRKMNKDVDLAVNSSDFGMGFPEWEEGNITENVDPYKINRNDIKNSWTSPSWIRYFDFLNTVSWKKGNKFAKIKARIILMKLIREYDIIETHLPWYIYSQFSGIPYVVYDAGVIRFFPYGNGIYDKLSRRGYRKAKAIMIANPDTFEISDNLQYLNQKKIFPIAFAIDPEKYKPFEMKDLRSKYAKEDDILLFSPGRQYWKEKGNDKMIKAFAKFVKIIPNSKLILTAWSLDEINSKNLVKNLGISDKVAWIKPVPKNQLIQYYNAADIVLDQFILGSWGTSTPEAMSCGKPVLMFYKKNYIIRAFGEEPPILNSLTVEDIFTNLVKLAKDKQKIIDIGRKSREWIIKTHSPRLVASKHLEIIEADT